MMCAAAAASRRFHSSSGVDVVEKCLLSCAASKMISVEWVTACSLKKFGSRRLGMDVVVGVAGVAVL